MSRYNTSTTMIMTVFLIFGMFSAGNVNHAHACSCAAITDQEALEKSFASFVGTPIKIESPSGLSNIVTFQIEKPIKNIDENTTEIAIITSVHSASCGYNFENNTRYLVHTYGSENQKTLETGLCSVNQNLGSSDIPMQVEESNETNYLGYGASFQIIIFLVIAGIIVSFVVFLIVRKRRR